MALTRKNLGPMKRKELFVLLVGYISKAHDFHPKWLFWWKGITSGLPRLYCPRDPGSPSENGNGTLRRWFNTPTKTPIIVWEYDWIPRVMFCYNVTGRTTIPTTRWIPSDPCGRSIGQLLRGNDVARVGLQDNIEVAYCDVPKNLVNGCKW